MFACACYPEHAEFAASVEAEARHQIARLSSHPSVVLWCGGNECVWGRECWGHAATDTLGPWKERTKDRPWGAGYWFDLLPRLIRELDPTRPYWPNSPASGPALPSGTEPAPNDADHGNRHTWDAPPGSEAFRAIVPRFCAEFGQQSPPNMETLGKVVKPEELQVDSAAMHHRQRGTGGMSSHIDEPLATWIMDQEDANKWDPRATPSGNAFADWARYSQTAQTVSLEAAIESLAANRPRCMGALVWQLNDAWPGMSWSLIDSDGRPKPAYEAVKAAFGKINP
jgi:beta-mannosidase